MLVSLQWETRLSDSSVILISHKWVVLPICNGIALAKTNPLLTPFRWFAEISIPLTAWVNVLMYMCEAALPTDSAKATDAPPCSNFSGWKTFLWQAFLLVKNHLYQCIQYP